MTWRRWVLVGMLGALAGALRVPFAFVPNVQPATALVIVAGLALGVRVGLGVGVMVPLVSNVFLGHGPWTPFQMMAWGGVGLVSGLLPTLPRWLMAAWGAVAAFAFGLVMDTWAWIAFAYPHEWATFLPVVARGLPFNIAHAVATAGVLAWVGPRLQSLLGRAKIRILGEAPRTTAQTTRPRRSGLRPDPVD